MGFRKGDMATGPLLPFEPRRWRKQSVPTVARRVLLDNVVDNMAVSLVGVR